jgi:hypothetical protein
MADEYCLWDQALDLPMQDLIHRESEAVTRGLALAVEGADEADNGEEERVGDEGEQRSHH